MPPFAGNSGDREILANYIIRAVQKKKADAQSAATEASPSVEKREGEKEAP